MTTLAVVAQSARALAAAAALDGYQVLAVDLFGDVDTRQLSRAWWPAGARGSLHIDSASVLAALRDIAGRGGVAGWVAGSGCEGLPGLLAGGAVLLPLIGTAPQAVQRVRDPLAFFGFLAAQGIDHPEVRSTAPSDRAGWLVKDALGCGGWHIRRAAHPAATAAGPQHYYQRRAQGTPMSATFCANGSQAVVLGFNQMIVRSFGARPFVYCGVLGPVPLAAAPARAVQRAVQLLSAGMALQGLCSLDFLLDGDDVRVLEVNPRPPASMALYGRQVAGGVMAAHVRACQLGALPTLQPLPAGEHETMQGTQIVFAPHSLHIAEAQAQALRARPDCHDLPAAGTALRRGDPLCSLSARGADLAQLRRRLDEGQAALLQTLEPTA